MKQINYIAPQLRLAMGKIDKNKDGFIDYPEFIAAQQAAQAEAQAVA